MVRISDMQIIEVLLHNSNKKNTEIARELGVTEAAVRKRIEKLERNGTIRAYTIDVDVRKLGYKIKALIGVDVSPERYTSIIEKLKIDDTVKTLYTASGDHMIMFEAWFKTQSELNDYVKKLNRMWGVTKTCPAIIIDKVK